MGFSLLEFSPFSFCRYFLEWKIVRKWEREGRLPPSPHIIKQRVLKEYGRKFSINTLVETGTYVGEMVYAVTKNFSQIISIELDNKLFEMAKNYFKDYGHITILEGDSGEILGQIIPKLDVRCLFWLDGHYSSGITAKGKLETPIISELENILENPSRDDVILIDDARCFIGENDYPTIEELRNFIFEKRADVEFHIKDDIIRVHKAIN